MKALVTAVTELFGLFVEDGSLAVGILLWVLCAALALPRIPGSEAWRAPAMFIGLIALLLENVWRSARRSSKFRKG